MARSNFGGTGSDIVLTIGPDRALRLAAANLTFWSAQSGGSRYVDLLLDGVAVSQITVGPDGQIPTFSGPDGISEVWADAGGARVRMVAPGSLVVGGGGIATVAPDDDGVPYFDPAGIPGSVSSVLADTDGTPYFVIGA